MNEFPQVIGSELTFSENDHEQIPAGDRNEQICTIKMNPKKVTMDAHVIDGRNIHVVMFWNITT